MVGFFGLHYVTWDFPCTSAAFVSENGVVVVVVLVLRCIGWGPTVFAAATQNYTLARERTRVVCVLT